MNVLLVEDEPIVQRAVRHAVERHWVDAEVTTVDTLPAATRALDAMPVQAGLVDLGLAPAPALLTGLGVVERFVAEGLADRLLVTTGHGPDALRRASEAGARLVFPKPLPTAALVMAGRHFGFDVPAAESLGRLVGRSGAMTRLREDVVQVAGAPDPVLLVGESGTNKELVARAIHAGRGPFVTINCGQLDNGLVETTLFGHGKGAFTGAGQARVGAIEEAGGGVLFLDEIADLPLAQQVKLLRVLEGHPFQPVGERRCVTPRARIVAATHDDLEERVREGRFREDLLYRISTLTIDLPPLRERLEDLGELVAALMVRRAEGQRRTLTGDALAMLAGHTWPGNVREVGRFVARVSVSGVEAIDGPVGVAEAARELGVAWPEGHTPMAARPLAKAVGAVRAKRVHGPLDVACEAARREAVAAAYLPTRSVSEAARLLGRSRRSVARDVARFGLK